jgi:hypothetical protein
MRAHRTTYKTLTHSGQVTLRYTVKHNDTTFRDEWFTSRAQRRFETQERWKCLRELDRTGDELAYRAFVLQSEGIETVQNAIMHTHGRPNLW